MLVPERLELAGQVGVDRLADVEADHLRTHIVEQSHVEGHGGSVVIDLGLCQIG